MANASLEILLNPRTLIQVEHYRLLLIPLPFTWFETASLTIVPVYLTPLQPEEINRGRAPHSELLHRGKNTAHPVLAKLCELAL